MMSTHRQAWLLALSLLCVGSVASAPRTFEQRLGEANKLRKTDPQRFAVALDELNAVKDGASSPQLQRLRYLRAYQSVVYRNELEEGIAEAKALFEDATEIDLKFRAGSLLVNSYALSRNFSDGLRQLNQTLPMRYRVQDKDIRHDGIDSAAALYNQLGQYQLGLKYAETTLSDNPNPGARCAAGLFRVEAQYHLAKLPIDDASIYGDIGRCLAVGDRMAANFTRAILSRKLAARGDTDKAIELLETHLAEVSAIGYHLLIAEVRAQLAELKLKKGDLGAAKAHAEVTVAHAQHVASSLPLATAYKVLYEIADRQGKAVEALGLYRRYAEADKAHLTDVNSRDLAYQLVREETLQKTQQIELLNRQNQVLQLQQRVDKQASQNTHLLVVLLTFLVAGIGYWAYKIKRVQMSLRRFAETDALTNISNRHHFSQQAELALAYSAKAGEPCALIMFDLDHFKAINDGYGHDTGDWVLKRVAETCKGHCRKIDHLGRLGGEEFAILLQGVDLRTATRLAEDCRVRIAQIDTRESGFTFVVTASFGVSASPLSGYGLRQLLSHADQMLYCAKRGGRNRVHAYLGDTLNPPQLQVVSRNDDLAARRDGALSADGAAENLG